MDHRELKISPLRFIHAGLATYSAADVAELFLSPTIAQELLNQATLEDGPSLWIVNRSDVYSETLRKLCKHPLENISKRASEKLSLRQNQLTFYSPPEIPDSLDEIPEFMIEDLLGHPLVPLQVPLYFLEHLNEDYRSSAALSLTRRLLEHPPNFNFDLLFKEKIVSAFFHYLKSDLSPMVRAYIARIPFFSKEQITEAYHQEVHPLVRARLLQNSKSSEDLFCLESAIKSFKNPDAARECQVLALDERFPHEDRQKLFEISLAETSDKLSLAIHAWYLQAPKPVA